MLPKTLALIDSDVKYTESLSQYLYERGVAVDVFDDGNSFLAHSNPYDYEFYLVELMLPVENSPHQVSVTAARQPIRGAARRGEFSIRSDPGRY
jgi:DNA-binding response OmpR family regulator